MEIIVCVRMCMYVHTHSRVMAKKNTHTRHNKNNITKNLKFIFIICQKLVKLRKKKWLCVCFDEKLCFKRNGILFKKEEMVQKQI